MADMDEINVDSLLFHYERFYKEKKPITVDTSFHLYTAEAHQQAIADNTPVPMKYLVHVKVDGKDNFLALKETVAHVEGLLKKGEITRFEYAAGDASFSLTLPPMSALKSVTK
ncbi:hypothetical protein HDU67_008284 [Dinochytrium kinnereticum]|nr:hypothetical protein HDU67_008284 [Dinochytrium kinnereticum]